MLLSADLVTLRLDQGIGEWLQMIEVNGANKRGHFETTWVESMHIMSNAQAVCKWRQQACWTNMTDTIDPICYSYGSKKERMKIKTHQNVQAESKNKNQTKQIW